MKTTNNDAIESLRSFAVANNEIDFAHLCTAALDGEVWAVERIAPVVTEHANDVEFCALNSHWVGNALIATTRTLIRSTNTARPDGAIARKMEI
jgi:hypothetical protein